MKLVHLLGGREFVVLASRGGGYAELTLAHTVPAMAELIPLAEQSLADAERAIDGLSPQFGSAAPVGTSGALSDMSSPRCR